MSKSDPITAEDISNGVKVVGATAGAGAGMSAAATPALFVAAAVPIVGIPLAVVVMVGGGVLGGLLGFKFPGSAIGVAVKN